MPSLASRVASGAVASRVARAGRCGRSSARVSRVVAASRETGETIEETVVTPWMTRRALAVTLAVALAASPDATTANVLEDAARARRVANATFVVGPVATSRARTAALRRDAETNGDVLDAGAVRDRVISCSLDCTEARGVLGAYAKGREVCTFAILARSVTRGPAAKNEEGSEEYVNVTRALADARARFADVELALGAGAGASEAFDACDASLRRLAEALVACFRLSDDERREVIDAVPGAFAA